MFIEAFLFSVDDMKYASFYHWGEEKNFFFLLLLNSLR